jgi:hypothetical protein
MVLELYENLSMYISSLTLIDERLGRKFLFTTQVLFRLHNKLFCVKSDECE